MNRRTIGFKLYPTGRVVEVRDCFGRVVNESDIADDSVAMRDWWVMVLFYQKQGWAIVQFGACMGDAVLEKEGE